MAIINKEKMTAEIDGDVAVILLGLRINKPWKIHKWLYILRAMRAMLTELQAHPETGYLGHVQYGFLVIVYFRSFEHIEAYARNKEHSHLPAWAKFQKAGGYSSGDVGLWHELYVISPQRYEAVYTAMPPIGLGKFSRLVPAVGHRHTSRGRLKQQAEI